MFNSVLIGAIKLSSFCMCIGTAIVLGILLSLVFMFKTRHSKNFAFALALLPMTVAMVIMMVNGNIGAGIAVAGAFTLVRFRSVPGTAREIAAIFSAMAIGLSVGMGYLGVAVLFFVFVAVITILLTLINFGGTVSNEKQLRILIPENYNYEGLFDEVFDKYTTSARLEKVKTTNMGTLFELTYIISFKGDKMPKDFFDELRTRNGNLNITVGAVADTEML